MTFTIRPATRDDVAGIAGVFRRVRLEALPYLPVLHTPEGDAEYFGGHVMTTCTVLLAESEGLAGFIAWRRGWVDHLYIDADCRGRGIGSALMARAMADEPLLDLWAFQKNMPAIDFYRRRGFRVMRETDGRDNEEQEPDVLMRWERETA